MFATKQRIGSNYGTFVSFIDDIMATGRWDIHYVIELALRYEYTMSSYVGRQHLRRLMRERYNVC